MFPPKTNAAGDDNFIATLHIKSIQTPGSIEGAKGVA